MPQTAIAPWQTTGACSEAATFRLLKRRIVAISESFERSSATSLPEPRTSHNISNVEVIERRGDLVDVRFNWHTMYFRYKTVDPYYGTSFYTIDFSGESPLIRRKTVVLKNDYIHHVVDVYHI